MVIFQFAPCQRSPLRQWHLPRAISRESLRSNFIILAPPEARFSQNLLESHGFSPVNRGKVMVSLGNQHTDIYK
jgi:hypothetical protein